MTTDMLIYGGLTVLFSLCTGCAGFFGAMRLYADAGRELATSWAPNTRNHRRADLVGRQLEHYAMFMYNSCDEAKLKRVASFMIADYQEILMGRHKLAELTHQQLLAESFNKHRDISQYHITFANGDTDEQRSRTHQAG